MRIADRKRAVTNALNALFSDKNFALRDTKEALEEIHTDIDSMIDALQEDIDREGGI